MSEALSLLFLEMIDWRCDSMCALGFECSLADDAPALESAVPSLKAE